MNAGSHCNRFFLRRRVPVRNNKWPSYTAREYGKNPAHLIKQRTINRLLLGEEVSPSIGNTLWRVSTMFARPAITAPEVNGFG